jgi:hypothetical protein
MLAKSSATTLIAVVFLAIALPAVAQKSAAQKLVDLARDNGCSIVIETERDEWRDANASDYQTSGWKAWMEQTKSATPWRTTGDFDGDGIADVAKVVIRKSDNAWMMGVEFGYRDRKDCRRFQIASNTDKPEHRLVGVLTLRKDESSLACNHVAERAPANCKLAGDEATKRRTHDYLLMTDDIPITTAMFAWRQYGDRKRSDGSPLMTFNSVPVEITALSFAQTPGASDAGQSQKGDRVSAEERKRLVAEFNSAYDALEKRPYRAVTDVVSMSEGVARKSKVITEFTPQAMRSTSQSGDERSVIVMVDGRAWSKTDNESWKNLGAAVMPPTGLGASFGTMVIKAVKRSVEQGRKLKTVELYEKADATETTDAVSIDEATGLPYRRTTEMRGVQTVTSVYDFNVMINISAPQ